MIDDPLNRLSVLRGSALPHSKLSEDKVMEIWQIVARRNELKAELAGMTNQAIATRFGVHIRTIDRVTALESWGHVDGWVEPGDTAVTPSNA